MGGVNSKKTSTRITEYDRTILKLKQQRDKLKQYQRIIEQLLNRDSDIAKTLINNGHKERAKLLIRKKMFQEKLVSKLDGQLNNLEQMVNELEFTQIEMQVVDGLKIATETLKKVNATLNITDIEIILDETREGVEKQKEITELISGILTEEDEIAVEEELSALIGDEMPILSTEESKIVVRNEDNAKGKAKKSKEEKKLLIVPA